MVTTFVPAKGGHRRPCHMSQIREQTLVRAASGRGVAGARCSENALIARAAPDGAARAMDHACCRSSTRLVVDESVERSYGFVIPPLALS